MKLSFYSSLGSFAVIFAKVSFTDGQRYETGYNQYPAYQYPDSNRNDGYYNEYPDYNGNDGYYDRYPSYDDNQINSAYDNDYPSDYKGNNGNGGGDYFPYDLEDDTEIKNDYDGGPINNGNNSNSGSKGGKVSKSKPRKKGHTGPWNGTIDGVHLQYDNLPLIANDGRVNTLDVIKLWQFDTLPLNTSVTAQNCFALDRDDVCVYPHPKAEGLIHDHDVSQIRIAFPSYQYLQGAAKGIEVGFYVECSKEKYHNVNYEYFGISKDYAAKKFTMVLMRTGKCHYKKASLKNFQVKIRTPEKTYDCGVKRGVCDLDKKLERQKCERIDVFTPVFVDMIRDCGVPSQVLE